MWNWGLDKVKSRRNNGEEVFVSDPVEMGTEKRGQLQKVVCYRAREETAGTNLEIWRER